MNDLELEIFEQSSGYSELRLRSGDGLRTRSLDRMAIDQLIEVVDRAYAEDSVSQRVFGSAELRGFGEMLFNFLDGDERWFSGVLADPQGVMVRIAAGERLRHLPWELVVRDGSYLAVSDNAPLLPVRAASKAAVLGSVVPKHNRPLRVLFMAASPEGVEPVLSYEAEEAGILSATADTGTELVVEESGTLEGLRFTATSYGPGYFDVLHVSGHATIDNGEPKFLVENELGGRALVTADQIARAMDGRWPSPDTAAFSKGSLLFGLHAARDRLAAGAQPILVEGPFDAIAADPARFTGIAPCGTALTSRQAQALARVVNLAERQLLLALDGDRAGRNAAIRAHDILSAITTNTTAAIIPANRDPAEILQTDGAPALATILSHARSLATVVIDAHLDRWAPQLRFAEGQVAAMRSASQLIARALPSEIKKKHS